MTWRFSALPAISLFMVAGCASPERAAEFRAELAAEKAASQAMTKAMQDTTADNLPMDSASVQRRREQVATMLEKHNAYRGLIDDGAPRLLNAKFAGPFEIGGNIFYARETIYCVSAEIESPIPWPVPTVRTTALRIKRTDSGEVVRAQIGVNSAPTGCASPKYGPFPELERARARRREAMGKSNG